jgi:acetate kinase
VRVLSVNAGSTSLKLHVVEDGRATSVDDFVSADAIGHRVVHGGERYTQPTVITGDVEHEIARMRVLAPLQNGRTLEGIAQARAALPGIPQVAVFDTGFHATMPPASATYAIPTRWRNEFGIRRFGFHGISVQWVASQVRVPRLVVCHLGGGCSVTAVRDGHSVDTTMGFTPLEGIPMATRSGSIDPGALIFLLKHGPLQLSELEHELEHDSGLAGLSGGGSGDIRDASQLALDVFTHRVATAVGAMAVACDGLDHLVFTGGIGEHADDVRERITDRVRFLGEFNVSVIPAREELVIATETERTIQYEAPANAGPPLDRG